MGPVVVDILIINHSEKLQHSTIRRNCQSFKTMSLRMAFLGHDKTLQLWYLVTRYLN